MGTKDELVSWLKQVRDNFTGVYIVINGGGISYADGEDINEIIDVVNSDAYGNVCILKKGEEYPDFKYIMSDDEYSSTDCFVCIRHNTQYNCENMDIQIQIYNL